MAVEYSADLAAEICDLLANGMTLKQICRIDYMPCESTIKRWVRNDVNGFAKDYLIANDGKYEAWEDEIIDIADDDARDWVPRIRKDGSVESAFNTEHVQRSKMRIDARQRLMDRRRPDLYATGTARSAALLVSPGARTKPTGKSKGMSMNERARHISQLIHAGGMSLKPAIEAEFSDVSETAAQAELPASGPVPDSPAG